MSRTRIVVAWLAFAVALGIAGDVAAIIGGTVLSGSAYDAVVLVYDEIGGFECSGALIASSVVLTAATCLPDATASDYLVLGGGNPFATPLFSILASEVHVHPGFDEFSFAHDVGVLVLSSSPDVTPLRWAATDLGFYQTGLSVSVQGFGVTNAVNQTGDGIRRGTVATISSNDAATFVTDSSGGQGPCTGDTGGPALPVDAAADDIVIGVTAHGDQSCAEFAAYERTDANAAFLSIFAPEPSAPTASLAAIGAILLWRRRASR